MTANKRAKPTARGRGRLNAEETAALDERVLAAAEAVFLSQGYAGASMDAIAKEAEITRRTLYLRYANKAEVLTAVVNRLLDAAMAPHQKGVRPRTVGRDPELLLLQIARELASLSEAPHTAGINRLVFAEAAQTPDLARLFLDLHARAADDVRTNLEELREEGSLPRLPNSKLAAVIFIEMAASMPRLRALLGAPLSRKETNDLTAAAVQIFIHGCGKP